MIARGTTVDLLNFYQPRRERIIVLQCHGFYLFPGLIERKYSLISTSYLAGLFDNFILLQNCVCFGDFVINEDTL